MVDLHSLNNEQLIKMALDLGIAYPRSYNTAMLIQLIEQNAPKNVDAPVALIELPVEELKKLSKDELFAVLMSLDIKFAKTFNKDKLISLIIEKRDEPEKLPSIEAVKVEVGKLETKVEEVEPKEVEIKSDLKSCTKPELFEILDSKGIKYTKTFNKDKLISLIESNPGAVDTALEKVVEISEPVAEIVEEAEEENAESVELVDITNMQKSVKINLMVKMISLYLKFKYPIVTCKSVFVAKHQLLEQGINEETGHGRTGYSKNVIDRINQTHFSRLKFDDEHIDIRDKAIRSLAFESDDILKYLPTLYPKFGEIAESYGELIVKYSDFCEYLDKYINDKDIVIDTIYNITNSTNTMEYITLQITCDCYETTNVPLPHIYKQLNKVIRDINLDGCEDPIVVSICDEAVTGHILSAQVSTELSNGEYPYHYAKPIKQTYDTCCGYDVNLESIILNHDSIIVVDIARNTGNKMDMFREYVNKLDKNIEFIPVILFDNIEHNSKVYNRYKVDLYN